MIYFRIKSVTQKSSKLCQRISCPLVVVVQITRFQKDEIGIKNTQLYMNKNISSQFFLQMEYKNVLFVMTTKAPKKKTK